MAKFQAIAAVSNAIRCLLADAGAETPGPAGTTIELDDGAVRRAGGEPRVSISLYRVLPNAALSNRAVQPRRPHPPSIALDLHYLVTASSADALTAQELLGWAIRMLADTPVLPAALLNAYRPGLDVFAPDEDVELVWEPLSLADLHVVRQLSPRGTSSRTPCSAVDRRHQDARRGFAINLQAA